ncbi:hypothetical protein RBQ61_00015 [Sedimentibacter sp. MB35-C1]|uniref:hypothetical protein n=1 Tax=Sedimentibacter sp. MB35-C1 TaxID=3070995 RepID=UPI0027E0E4F2|nr:hypothetical protein [Sedimentibacter sp. MB35-C1]WMJ77355.1 hypothetical protein RBQ61_00015 [Sedimentibacter sp. MB35-C1]
MNRLMRILKEIQSSIQEIPEVVSIFTQAGSSGIMRVWEVSSGTGSMTVILSELEWERDRKCKRDISE